MLFLLYVCWGWGGEEYPVPCWMLSNIPDFYPLEFIEPPLPQTVTTINISTFGQISLGDYILAPCGLKLLLYWCFLCSPPKQAACPAVLVSGCASEEPKQDREIEEGHTRGMETICEMVSGSETEKIMSLRWGVVVERERCIWDTKRDTSWWNFSLRASKSEEWVRRNLAWLWRCHSVRGNPGVRAGF